LFLIFLDVLNLLISHVARYAPSSQIQNISKIWGSIVPARPWSLAWQEFIFHHHLAPSAGSKGMYKGYVLLYLKAGVREIPMIAL